MNLCIRPATPQDAHAAALLHNATQEPHFALSAAEFVRELGRQPSRHWVAEDASSGQLLGLSKLSLPDVHPTHGWVGLHVHPDHLQGEAPTLLLKQLRAAAQAAGRKHLWASVREDYIPSWPDLSALGFSEHHRTFGGGIFLNAWSWNETRHARELAVQGVRLEEAATHKAEAEALYMKLRADKVTAPPTILPETDADGLPEGVIWEAARIAFAEAEAVGLCLPVADRLDAYNAVLAVAPQYRGKGVGTALLGSAALGLQRLGLGFLNTAGVASDAAYLGTLRRVGASIEPDWVAWEG